MPSNFYWDKGKLMYGRPVEKKEDKPENSHLLFVYGTLKHHNRHMLKGSVLIRRNICAPHNFYLMTYKRLPVMVEYKKGIVGEGLVCGDVYQVTDEVLKEIDAFKIKKNLYERRSVVIGDYGDYKCWTYLYPTIHPNAYHELGLELQRHGDYGKYLDSLINEEELLANG